MNYDPKIWRTVRSFLDDQLDIDRAKLKEDMNQGFRNLRGYRDQARQALTEFLKNFVASLSLDELMELAELVKDRLSGDEK